MAEKSDQTRQKLQLLFDEDPRKSKKNEKKPSR